MVSEGKSICQFDWDTKQTKVVATVDDDKETRINDGKCDASGRLWFGKFIFFQCTSVSKKYVV